MVDVLNNVLGDDDIVIHGDCRGADKMGGMIAEELGLEVVAFPADWSKFGPSAGPIRNRQMLDEGKPDLVLAFHKNIDSSKGTKDMVNISKKAGIPVRIFT